MSTKNKHFDVDALTVAAPHCWRVDKSEASRQKAERRRAALRRFMAERTVNPNEWATAAAFKTANAIYNFLGGRSRALSYTTYEKLAAVFAVPVPELTGDPIGPEEMAEARFVAVYRRLQPSGRARAIKLLELLLEEGEPSDESAGRASKKRTG